MTGFSSRSIEGYDFRERLGAGGFGEVYRANQPAMGREVAIKVILPRYAAEPEFIRRFEVEAQTVARLEHPHIVPLYDYWRDPTGAYLVMRWLRSNLRNALAHEPWKLETTARLLDQIAAALTFAHREGIIHRDIKPENILLDEDNNAYLSDFGIAKDVYRRDFSQDEAGDSASRFAAYVSPEQIRQEPVSERTDLYSLGCVVYEILTGQSPYSDATTPDEYATKHLSVPLPTISLRDNRIPAAVDEVLQTATAKNPSHRYANAARFAAAFRAAVPSRLPRIPFQPFPEALTERELDVLRLLTDGLSNSEIAERLVLSPTTIKWYVRQVYGKLDVHSRQQAIERVANLGLFEKAKAAAGRVPDSVNEVAVPVNPSAELVENPYKGLRAFQESDVDDFFGRAALTQQLLSRLSEQGDDGRFLAIVGPSGSGKSSVVRAGLIPALRKGALAESPHPFITDLLPGTHPLEELEAALLRVASNPMPGLLDDLRDDQRGLVRAVKRLLPTDTTTEVILVIDQFEELFTLVEDETTRAHFIDNLLSAISDPRGRVRVIVTLRADFYDRPLLYPRLAEMIRTHTEVIVPLSAREMEQAMLAPAERVGVRWESGLVTTIVHELAEQPGILPLLQYALTELFERRDGSTMTLGDYNAMGGVLGALSRRADILYSKLDAVGQSLVRQLFMRLITLGEGVEDTRRRALLGEVLALGDESAMEEVISAFTQYRLLTLDRDPLTHSPTVEIAHEALIREWGRLREWLAESREDIRIERRLAQSAADWTAGNDASYLASGVRLTEFETWAAGTGLALTAEERTYLDASLAERARMLQRETERKQRELRLEQRSRRLRHALMVVLLLATLGALALSGVTLSERDRAQANFERAEQQRLYLTSNEAMDDGASGNIGMALALRSLAYGYSAGADAALMRATRQGLIVRRLGGHPSEGWDVLYSPDGKLIATTTNDGTRLFDAQTGELRFHLPSYDSGPDMGYITFHPSGVTIATLRSPGMVQFWDVTTGEETKRFTYEDGAYFVGFVRGGDSFITFEPPRTVRERDTETGELLKTLEFPEDGFLATAHTASPTLYLYVSDDNTITLQNIETEAVTCQIESSGVSRILNSFLNQDDSILIYQTEDNYSLHVVDTATCSEIGLYAIHPGVMTWMAFSSDGETIYTSDTTGSIYHWELRTGRVLNSFMGMRGTITTIALSPDEHSLASVGFSQNALVYDLTLPTEPRAFDTGLHGTWRVRFSPDGQHILAGSPKSVVRLDADTGAVIQRYVPDFSIRDYAFSPDGTTFFVSVEMDTAGAIGNYLVDATTGDVIRGFEGLTEIGNHVAYSPDGKLVASSSWDGTAWVWDVATGEPLVVYEEHVGATAIVSFSPDSKTALSTGVDGTVRLWDAATGETLRVFDDGDGAVVLVGVFSPDGKLILTTSNNGLSHVWDVQTGKMLHTLVGHTAPVWAGVFSPDGSMIATAGDGVRIWDTETGELRRVLPAMNTGGESWPAFSPDGQWLAVGSMDSGQVLLWRVELDNVIADICARPWLDVTPEERVQYGITDDAPGCSHFGGVRE